MIYKVFHQWKQSDVTSESVPDNEYRVGVTEHADSPEQAAQQRLDGLVFPHAYSGLAVLSPGNDVMTVFRVEKVENPQYRVVPV